MIPTAWHSRKRPTLWNSKKLNRCQRLQPVGRINKTWNFKVKWKLPLHDIISGYVIIASESMRIIYHHAAAPLKVIGRVGSMHSAACKPCPRILWANTGWCIFQPPMQWKQWGLSVLSNSPAPRRLACGLLCLLDFPNESWSGAMPSPYAIFG